MVKKAVRVPRVPPRAAKKSAPVRAKPPKAKKRIKPMITKTYSIRPKHEPEPAKVAAVAAAPAAPTPAPATPAPDARDEKMGRLVEANKKLGDEVNSLRASNEGLVKLKNSLEGIVADHREVGDRLAALSK